MDRGAPRPGTRRGRAAPVLPPGARHRTRSPARGAAVRSRGALLEPLAGGWLSGRYRQGAGQPASSRAGGQAARFDATSPENAAKLAAAEALAQLAEEAGLTLVQLALAFVLEHPAITSAIIGPRTFEQLDSQLGADKIRLTRDVLDRIDEIIPPGTNLSTRDAGYTPPSLTDSALRRRPRN